jgi:TFIIF-interacting CTD phosphatase-like protein
MSKQITLPKPRSKKLSDKLLLLDLDDTFQQKYVKNETKMVYHFDYLSATVIPIKVVIRPFALTFLKVLSQYYEIVVNVY